MDVRLDAGAVKPRGQRPAWRDAEHGQVWSCAAHRRAGDPWVCRQMEAFSFSEILGRSLTPFCESPVKCTGCLSGDKQGKKGLWVAGLDRKTPRFCERSSWWDDDGTRLPRLNSGFAVSKLCANWPFFVCLFAPNNSNRADYREAEASASAWRPIVELSGLLWAGC